MLSHSSVAEGCGLLRAELSVESEDREKKRLSLILVASGVCFAVIAIHRESCLPVLFEIDGTWPEKSWAGGSHPDPGQESLLVVKSRVSIQHVYMLCYAMPCRDGLVTHSSGIQARQMSLQLRISKTSLGRLV